MSVTRVVGIRGLEDALRRDLPKLREKVIGAARIAAGLTAHTVAGKAPVAFGPLRQSIHPENRPNGARVIADAPYAAAVELGSRPHWAPIKAIQAWCDLKGFPEAAYAVRAKIARDGTRPQPYMRPSIPAAVAELREAVLAIPGVALGSGGVSASVRGPS